MPLTMTREIQPRGGSFQALLARGVKAWMGSITFDNSYAAGGETPNFGFTPDQVGLEPVDGYRFVYDHTNSKIKVLKPATALIVEEAVVVASHVGTLKHKPFYILAVDVTAGSTTGPFNVIPVGETPVTTECAVNFATGGLTFVAADAVTAVRITYIPLQEEGPFRAANLVIDESVTAAAAKATLANRAAAVQYVYDDTDGARCALEPVGEAPTATHNAVIDITNGSSLTDIDSHADDEGNTLKVTYIKYEAFQAWVQLGDGDLTLASEIYQFGAAHDIQFLAIPGLGTQLVGEATATNVELIWSGPSGTLGAGVPVLSIEDNEWQTNESSAITTLAVPIIYLDPLLGAVGWMEEEIGADLSALVVKAFALEV